MIKTHVCISLGPWEMRWTFALGEAAREAASAERAGEQGGEHNGHLQRPYELRSFEFLEQPRSGTRQTGMVGGDGVHDRW